MSTIWFARRGAEVLSIEADAAWFERVRGMLSRVPGHRVRLRCESPPYGPELLGGERFDFALIDGEDRAGAMRIALAAVRPGGFVYLDNADVPWSGHRSARDQALTRGRAEWFVDFTPFHVFVSAGLLVQLPADPQANQRPGAGVRPDATETGHDPGLRGSDSKPVPPHRVRSEPTNFT
jgi:predicted O-methyltransferase YrrM